MIRQHMAKKEKMLKIAESAIENKSKIEPGYTTTESLIKEWLSEVFDYAYTLGESSGLMMAKILLRVRRIRLTTSCQRILSNEEKGYM
jgi:hypothetical protein